MADDGGFGGILDAWLRSQGIDPGSSSFGGGTTQTGYHWETRTITSPRDPDLIAELTRQGAAWSYASPTTVTWQVQVLVPDAAQPGAGGGVGGFGGGGGGTNWGPSIRHLGAVFGHTFTSAQITQITNYLNGGGTLDEIAAKLEALRYVDENPEAFDQFTAEAQARKLIGAGKTLNRDERLNLALGTAPKAWLDLWETTAARTAAAMAGFDIGEGGDLGLSRKDIIGFLGRLPGRGDVGDFTAAFSQAAQWALNLGAFSRYAGLSLNKDKLADIASGIGGAEDIANLQRLVATDQAFAQFRVHPAFSEARQPTAVQ